MATLLLLTAGKGLRTPVLKALETDGLQHLHDPLLDLSLRQLLHPQTEGDVLIHIQVREQGVFLENGVDLPLIGRTSLILTPSNRTSPDVGVAKPPMIRSVVVFAAPAGSEKCEELFAVDIQIDVIENRLVVECHAEIPQANQLFGHVSSPIS